MPFPPSAACRFFDLPPVNLQNLPLHLTKNSFASAPTHLCGIALSFDSPLAQGFDHLRARYLPFVRGDSASVEAAKGLSDRPLETFGFPLIGWYRDQALAGRGGSVSRRDHNRSTGTRVRSQAEPTMKKGTRQTPAALRERGSGGEALLSEKRPLPK